MFMPLVIPVRPGQSASGERSQAIPDGASQDAAPAPSRPLPAAQAATIAQLRARIARIERSHDAAAPARSLPLGIPAIDQALPGGGIALGALHEAASAGADTEHAAAATLFVAGLLARLDGPVLWVLRQADLFAPGLAGAGLQPNRVIFVEAGKAVLAVMEEGLRHAALAAVVGEPAGRISLVASRRLHLAAERTGVLVILIRRSASFDDPALATPSAAVTRWRIAVLPSPPALPEAPETPGLGRARWRLDLTRCRGGEPGSWIAEACDAAGRLGLVPDIADRPHPSRLSA